MPRRVICAFSLWLLATAHCCFAQVGEARPQAMAVVIQADRAQIGSGAASQGATVFEGERLSTDAGGAMRLRTGNTLLFLNGQSSAAIHRGPNGLETELSSGTIVMSAVQASAMALLAGGAELRPAANGPAMAQVSIAGPKELVVIARRGALQFSYEGESELIPEGSSYRVVLDPSDDGNGGSQGTVSPAPQQTPLPPYGPPKKPKKRRKAFFFLILGAAAIATAWSLHQASVSPSAP